MVTILKYVCKTLEECNECTNYMISTYFNLRLKTEYANDKYTISFAIDSKYLLGVVLELRDFDICVLDPLTKNEIISGILIKAKPDNTRNTNVRFDILFESKYGAGPTTGLAMFYLRELYSEPTSLILHDFVKTFQILEKLGIDDLSKKCFKEVSENLSIIQMNMLKHYFNRKKLIE